MDIEDKEKIELIIHKLNQNGAFAAMNQEAIDDLETLIEPEKWEPKTNSGHIIYSGGSIHTIRGMTDNTADRLYGAIWPTKDLAKIARSMNKRNQLILQAKTEMGFGDGEYVICYSRANEKWKAMQDIVPQNPELTFETVGQAYEIIKMVGLNDN